MIKTSVHAPFEKTPYIAFILHLSFLISIFSFRSLGFISDFVLLIALGALCMEAIFFSLLSQVRMHKEANSLKEIQARMEQEETLKMEKANRSLLYLGHQIKTIQTELDAFKKGKVLKPSAIRHRIQA